MQRAAHYVVRRPHLDLAASSPTRHWPLPLDNDHRRSSGADRSRLRRRSGQPRMVRPYRLHHHLPPRFPLGCSAGSIHALLRSPCATHSPVSHSVSLKVAQRRARRRSTQNHGIPSLARFGLVPVYDGAILGWHQLMGLQSPRDLGPPPCSPRATPSQAESTASHPACPDPYRTRLHVRTSPMETRDCGLARQAGCQCTALGTRIALAKPTDQMVTTAVEGVALGLSQPARSRAGRWPALTTLTPSVRSSGLPLTTVHDTRRSVRTINRILVANRGEIALRVPHGPPTWAC